MEFDFSFQTLEFKKLFDSMQKLSSFYASYETILQFFVLYICLLFKINITDYNYSTKNIALNNKAS